MLCLGVTKHRRLACPASRLAHQVYSPCSQPASFNCVPLLPWSAIIRVGRARLLRRWVCYHSLQLMSSSGVRRRAAARMQAEGDSAVPLLSQEDQGYVHTPPESPRQHYGGQIIVWKPFDVTHFIYSIVYKAIHVLGACWHGVEATASWAFESCRGRDSAAHLQLSLLQEERLESLWTAIREDYKANDPSHQQLLRELWEYAFPGEPCTSLKCPRWKDMGWQGQDPVNDFRGAGAFGVRNLIYMARTYPQEFDRLMHKRTGKRSDWEYPFAAAGMNLTFMLSELLGLKHGQPGQGGVGQQGRQPPLPLDEMRKQPVFLGFVELLKSEPSCFEELYCAAFILLDRHWLQARASYMQFNIVLKGVLAELTRILKARPGTIARLRSMLAV